MDIIAPDVNIILREHTELCESRQENGAEHWVSRSSNALKWREVARRVISGEGALCAPAGAHALIECRH